MSEHLFDNGEFHDSAPAAVMEAVVAAATAVDQARLARLLAIAELESSRAFEYDGFTSVTAFLVTRCGMGVRSANRELFLARSLEHLPYATKLARSAGLTVGQLEVLAHAHSRHPRPFAADEPTLAEAASGLTLADTRRLVAYWSQAHDQAPDGADVEPSAVYLSQSWKGRGRLDGDLDPEDHALVNAALDSLISEQVRTTPTGELPPMPQLRGEALTELARRFLDAPATPTDHGNRPHLTVVVAYDTLVGTDPGGLCEMGDGTIISPAAAQRLACDANVCRLITGPDSEILDLGRTRRTVSPAQWKALRIRDRHCRFHGCRRPSSWTDAHHLRPWARGGLTDQSNLVLLCRRHHTLIHEGGWVLTGTADDLTVIRPDGTKLAHAPP